MTTTNAKAATVTCALPHPVVPCRVRLRLSLQVLP